MIHRSPMRVAVFGSFYRGHRVLSELLHHPDMFQVVGVATDDPSQSWVSPMKRVWQYPHTQQETLMVRNLAQQNRLPCYQGKVKDPSFYTLFEEHWRPDICIMATFGQRINQRLYEFPKWGFYNLHPCVDDGWPSKYAGSNPFQALLDDRQPDVVMALHRVDDGFDTGELIAYSEKMPIPPGVGVTMLHQLTAPMAAQLAMQHLVAQHHLMTAQTGSQPELLHTAAAPLEG